MVSISNILNLYNIFKTDRIYDKMDLQDEIICNLKFIGKIGEDEKINVKYMYVQPNNITTKISRTFLNVDTRANTINFVVNTIKKSIEIIQMLLKSESDIDKIKCVHIVKDLKKAMYGINNLKRTYNYDTMFCCQLETLQEWSNATIIDIEKKNVELFDQTKFGKPELVKETE